MNLSSSIISHPKLQEFSSWKYSINQSCTIFICFTKQRFQTTVWNVWEIFFDDTFYSKHLLYYVSIFVNSCYIPQLSQETPLLLAPWIRRKPSRALLIFCSVVWKSLIYETNKMPLPLTTNYTISLSFGKRKRFVYFIREC